MENFNEKIKAIREYKKETALNGDYGICSEFCRLNADVLRTLPAVALKKIQRENALSLSNYIKCLQGIGVDALNPQSQREHDDIFGTGDGFGGHIYGDNPATE